MFFLISPCRRQYLGHGADSALGAAPSPPVRIYRDGLHGWLLLIFLVPGSMSKKYGGLKISFGNTLGTSTFTGGSLRGLPRGFLEGYAASFIRSITYPTRSLRVSDATLAAFTDWPF